jgi:hypothetical protein
MAAESGDSGRAGEWWPLTAVPISDNLEASRLELPTPHAGPNTETSRFGTVRPPFYQRPPRHSTLQPLLRFAPSRGDFFIRGPASACRITSDTYGHLVSRGGKGWMEPAHRDRSDGASSYDKGGPVMYHNRDCREVGSPARDIPPGPSMGKSRGERETHAERDRLTPRECLWAAVSGRGRLHTWEMSGVSRRFFHETLLWSGKVCPGQRLTTLRND